MAINKCCLAGLLKVSVIGFLLLFDPRLAFGETLLLVDDHEILYRSGTKRFIKPFEKFSGNPVLKDQEKPWEVAIAWMSIHRDPTNGNYQLWYQSWSGEKAKDKTRRCVVCYGTSKDGRNFEKPSLGLFDYNGDPKTPIVLTANGGASDRYGASVIFDSADPDPGRRYKMAYYDFGMYKGKEHPGIWLAVSKDGVHWKKMGNGPVQPTFYGDFNTQVPLQNDFSRPWDLPLTMSDALDLIYDPVRKVYAIYGKMWMDGPEGRLGWKHGLGRIESPDFLNWSKPQLILTPNDQDPPFVEFHTAPVFYYEGIYFALIQILNRAVGGGVIDIEMAISRDGINFDRPFQNQFVITRGEKGSFDSGSIFTCATPVVLDDEIRFYYGAYSGGATEADDYSHKTGIGYAHIKKDRFAGIKPDDISNQPTLPAPLHHRGQITLKAKPLSKFKDIMVNVDANGGWVAAEILDRDGRRVPGFTLEDAEKITGDQLHVPVRWKNKAISTLPPNDYHLRLHLYKASAFAVYLENPKDKL